MLFIIKSNGGIFFQNSYEPALWPPGQKGLTVHNKKDEQVNPKQVYEMPVGARDLEACAAVGFHLAAIGTEPEDQERCHAAKDVQCMHQHDHDQVLKGNIIVPFHLEIQVLKSKILQYGKSDAQQESKCYHAAVQGHTALLKAAQGQVQRKAADEDHCRGNIEFNRQAEGFPIALGATHDIAAGKAAKHHDDAADSDPHGKLLRVYLSSLGAFFNRHHTQM